MAFINRFKSSWFETDSSGWVIAQSLSVHTGGIPTIVRSCKRNLIHPPLSIDQAEDEIWLFESRRLLSARRTKYLPPSNGTQRAMGRRRARGLRKARFMLKRSGDQPGNSSIAMCQGWYRQSEGIEKVPRRLIV